MDFRARLHHVIFGFSALLLAWYFSFLFSSELLPSEDLPAHIALTKLLREQLLHGNLVFYDTSYFSGWAAFAFYGFGFSLLAAVLSFPLSLFSAAPVVLACNLLLFVGLYSLPLALYRLALVLLPNDEPRLYAGAKPLLAAGSVVFCLWLYQHDGQFYGLGAGAYLAVGLAPQLLAHVLLVLSLSYFFEAAGKMDAPRWRLPLALTALVCTHLLTAAYAFALMLFSALVMPHLLRSAVRAIAVSLLLSSPWLLPLMQHISQFTLPDPYPPQGELLALLLRYPLSELLSSFRNHPIDTLRGIQFFPILFLLLLLMLAFYREAIEARTLRRLFVALVLLSFALGSTYVAASLPFAFHYYRFLSNTILVLLAIFLTTFSLLSVRREPKERALVIDSRRTTALGVLLIVLAISSLRLPSLELVQMETLQARWLTEAQKNVLEHLKTSGHRGRVLVEYIDDYKRVPYLSSHLLETLIPQESGREVAGGLFVESALRFRFTAVPAALLGAKLFSPYLVFSSEYRGSTAQRLEDLQALGIDTIIAASTEFIEQLQALGLASQSFGPYRLFELPIASPARIRQIGGPILSYYDPSGRLPFYLPAFYFAALGGLRSDAALLEIGDMAVLPAKTAYILSTDPDIKAKGKHIVPIQITPAAIDHYNPRYQVARSIPRFRSLATMFNSRPEFWADILEHEPAIQQELPSVDWDQQAQQFSLEGLRQGELYGLNYSFTPFLQCRGCVLYRGSSNEIVFEARQNSAQIAFSYFSERSSWLGVLAALLGCFALWLFYFSDAETRRLKRK